MRGGATRGGRLCLLLLLWRDDIHNLAVFSLLLRDAWSLTPGFFFFVICFISGLIVRASGSVISGVVLLLPRASRRDTPDPGFSFFSYVFLVGLIY